MLGSRWFIEGLARVEDLFGLTVKRKAKGAVQDVAKDKALMVMWSRAWAWNRSHFHEFGFPILKRRG